jgi:hypothetical protein
LSLNKTFAGGDETMTRPHEFTGAIKREKWRECTGPDGIARCENCTAPLRPGKFRFDHKTPIALGGESTLDNCQLWCTACDSTKTYGQDIPRIRKADRMSNAYIGHRPKVFRPLPGTRASGIKKPLRPFADPLDRRTGQPWRGR